MATTLKRPQPSVRTSAQHHLTTPEVWHEIDRSSFAVLGYVTPNGRSRSSGVVYKSVGQRLYIAVAPDSWKARQIASGGEVAVTVPVRRGGILALLFPIPPATISFHARVIVHPPGPLPGGAAAKALAALLPDERRESGVIIEVVPEGDFLTYGLKVSLANMRRPARAKARVAVSLGNALDRQPATSETGHAALKRRDPVPSS